MKTGVLLINLGTTSSPDVSSVRKYLSQFLNDPRVIDIHPLARFFLVNFIIVPFRSPKSAHLYKEIWTSEGSPFIIHSNNLKKKLAAALGNNYVVELGMRYQSPSLKTAVDKLYQQNIKKIIALPLYPQYASSSTGSSIQELFSVLQKFNTIPELKVINSFFDNKGFINAIKKVSEKYDLLNYEHFVFSYHGLPERQVLKAAAEFSGYDCNFKNCCDSLNEKNKLCYRASCFETTRLLISALGINSDNVTTCFQSRLGKDPWIKPFSDEVIVDLAKKGIKKVLVFSPAFVADCLETIHEIGVEYKALFVENGGVDLQLVESLNDHDEWVSALKNIVLENT